MDAAEKLARVVHQISAGDGAFTRIGSRGRSVTVTSANYENFSPSVLRQLRTVARKYGFTMKVERLGIVNTASFEKKEHMPVILAKIQSVGGLADLERATAHKQYERWQEEPEESWEQHAPYDNPRVKHTARYVVVKSGRSLSYHRSYTLALAAKHAAGRAAKIVDRGQS